MKISGIVAEYNPFHTGHAYQIGATRERLGGETAIVAVMSGNWVQRGECAVADKWTRAALALRGGVDLVLELPTVWATSSAERFAAGAVAMLEATGVVEVLAFGSESGDLEPLQAVADCLVTDGYRQTLLSLLAEGKPFAAARQRAAESQIGAVARCLASPNNNLAVEYLKALRSSGSSMTPMTIKRRGAGHDAARPADGFQSAGALRKLIQEDCWTQAEPFLPAGGADLLQKGGPASLSLCERGVLAQLKTMGADEFARLPDSGEGLSNRLARAVSDGCSLEEIYIRTKTKRYAHSRVRRLVLWAFLGLTEADRPGVPPYIRVLGMNDRGRMVLRHMEESSALPIITKPAHVKKLPEAAGAFFAAEARCTDLYNLCRRDLTDSACGMEYRKNPVIR